MAQLEQKHKIQSISLLENFAIKNFAKIRDKYAKLLHLYINGNEKHKKGMWNPHRLNFYLNIPVDKYSSLKPQYLPEICKQNHLTTQNGVRQPVTCSFIS